MVSEVRMVDVSEKPEVLRIAVAEGLIKLKKETLEAVKFEKIEKGNVLVTANIAAVLAAKRTSEIIPLCHQIPLTSVKVDFEILEDGIKVICEVKAKAKTGVEMEALTAVSAALLTIWDMVKSLEKEGESYRTCIKEIKVTKKQKI
ncbi:MAG: cyclic pyranopterin monophosphate synthase MoaC [Archaeoglobaceae archaeon]|nr:cyclic pyranopterin monophosphate synthase MoaC [Archaeoglobaceae archaeon]MCX8152133.1 cyclic pyranopterin monophosphate synthase MoaC [Archaeoglobaceae archaeon]MDW8013569.1 cyclic pyranopterin monophosphate synthase MoaC [Archaeoglobaceae archaeon]